MNDDFMMPSVNFVFDSNSIVGSSKCVQFNIINDSIIEANETFTVQLRDASSVVFSEPLTTVMILDDDCMSNLISILYMYMNFCLFI